MSRLIQKKLISPAEHGEKKRAGQGRQEISGDQVQARCGQGGRDGELEALHGARLGGDDRG